MIDVKDQLKDIPIDHVARGLGLDLKKRGGLQGECPTGHGSKGGKCFSLNPTGGNYFNCFDCGVGGDVIKLVMLKEGLEFKPAMEYLARNYRPDLLPLIDKARPEPDDPRRREYYQRASLYDLIYQYGKELLYQQTGQAALKYLLEERGYSLESLKQTDWIYWPPEKDIRAYLKKEQPEASESIKALKLSGYYGDNFRLAFPYRDRKGIITSFIKRATAPKGITVQTYDKETHEGVRWDSTPATFKDISLESKADLFNLHNCRGEEELVVLEGYPDALYFPTLGLKNVVAAGQGQLSKTHLEGLRSSGVKRVIISFDNDQVGPENTAKALEILQGTGIRGYVIDPPLLAPHKDPDELVKAHSSIEAFKKLIEQAEAGSRWQARHIASKHDIKTDIGFERLTTEALEAYADIKDRRDQRVFMESLCQATEEPEEVFQTKYEVIQEQLSLKRQQQAVKDLANRLIAKAGTGDLQGAEEELRKGLQAVTLSRGQELPGPYLSEELIADIRGAAEGLKTGYKSLDNIVRIPQGAITIIAGRPSHGKTTFQLNLLLNMLRTYQDKKFYFFSYEEARKMIGLKLIINLAGETLIKETNLGAYVSYLKERGLPNFKANQKIEEAIREYGNLAGSGRLIISDKFLPGEDLASTIGSLARPGEMGAVFIDYIQKIPLREKVGGARYEHLKRVSELLLEQAKTQDIPIIMGAQFGRPTAGQGSQSARSVKLDNLRESGDIEQDANTVLGLYNDSVVKMEEESKEVNDKEVSLDVHILKSRVGIVGRKVSLAFEGPVLRIKDKNLISM